MFRSKDLTMDVVPGGWNLLDPNTCRISGPYTVQQEPHELFLGGTATIPHCGVASIPPFMDAPPSGLDLIRQQMRSALEQVH